MESGELLRVLKKKGVITMVLTISSKLLISFFFFLASCMDLKSKGLVENWTKVLALHFGLKLLLLVWQHVDFDIRV